MDRVGRVPLAAAAVVLVSGAWLAGFALDRADAAWWVKYRDGVKTDAVVVGVVDGDTVDVISDRGRERIRLWGVDAPEKAQRSGVAAASWLRAKVNGEAVRVGRHARDAWGRTIADLELAGGERVSVAIVAAGWAWWYRAYAPKDEAIAAAEESAKAARRGLWVDSAPVPPWAFRGMRGHTTPPWVSAP